jgi:acyl-coenzyme A synthetase/AMP-(fatty) acid ligase
MPWISTSKRAGGTHSLDLPERGERRLFTYAKLLHDVEQIAAALRGMGISKGERVTVYMPTCPEAIMLMLAVVRIGAIHSVVFSGFGEKESLHKSILNSETSGRIMATTQIVCLEEVLLW